MEMRVDDEAREGDLVIRQEVWEREKNPSYLQLLVGVYATELERLARLLTLPDPCKFDGRAVRLQQLLYANLPWLQTLLQRQGLQVDANIQLRFKRWLPVAHAVATHLETLGKLQAPMRKKTLVGRAVAKRVTCESCRRIDSVLIYETVPPGQLVYPPMNCFDGYAERQRRVIIPCPRCIGSVNPVQQIVTREAVLKRFECHGCGGSVLAVESIPIGHPAIGHGNDSSQLMQLIHRYRQILASCGCSEPRLVPTSGIIARVSDIRIWLASVFALG